MWVAYVLEKAKNVYVPIIIVYTLRSKNAFFDLDLTKRHNDGVMKHFAAHQINTEILFKTHCLLEVHYFEYYCLSKAML